MGTSGFSRIALIGMLAGALALGACGRKGVLEPPPSASAVPAGPEAQQQSQMRQPALDANGFEDPRAQDQQALPPSKKTFFLDGLL